MPFHLKFFLYVAWWKGNLFARDYSANRYLLLTVVDYGGEGGWLFIPLKRASLPLVTLNPRRRLFINFFCAFASKYFRCDRRNERLAQRLAGLG